MYKNITGKIFLSLLLLVFSISWTFAYSKIELESNKLIYKKVIKDKFSDKLNNMSEKKLKKILLLIDTFIEKYDNDKNLSDSKKLKKVSLLLSFKEVISEKLEDEFWDINSILDTVNKPYWPIFIVTDKRCLENCLAAPIISQLKMVKWLEKANIIELDFSNKQAKDLLNTTWITKLPAVIFPDNNVDPSIKISLWKNNNESYYLNILSKFNPYEKRSSRWFSVLEKSIIYKIRNNSYIKWNNKSKILWLIYSDMECPYCARLHNSWTSKKLEKKYWTKLSYSLQHFPLSFHKNALPAAHYLECVWKIGWSEKFYKLQNKLFSQKRSDIETITASSVELWIDIGELSSCVDWKEFTNKIAEYKKIWTETFWITWTPWNVLINTNTWEYQVINWAYPTSKFIEIIDKLLE